MTKSRSQKLADQQRRVEVIDLRAQLAAAQMEIIELKAGLECSRMATADAQAEIAHWKMHEDPCHGLGGGHCSECVALAQAEVAKLRRVSGEAMDALEFGRRRMKSARLKAVHLGVRAAQFEALEQAETDCQAAIAALERWTK